MSLNWAKVSMLGVFMNAVAAPELAAAPAPYVPADNPRQAFMDGATMATDDDILFITTPSVLGEEKQTFDRSLLTFQLNSFDPGIIPYLGQQMSSRSGLRLSDRDVVNTIADIGENERYKAYVTGGNLHFEGNMSDKCVIFMPDPATEDKNVFFRHVYHGRPYEDLAFTRDLDMSEIFFMLGRHEGAHCEQDSTDIAADGVTFTMSKPEKEAHADFKMLQAVAGPLGRPDLAEAFYAIRYSRSENLDPKHHITPFIDLGALLPDDYDPQYLPDGLSDWSDVATNPVFQDPDYNEKRLSCEAANAYFGPDDCAPKP